MAMQQLRVGVAGATGYAGHELVRLLARHPHVQLTQAMASGAARGSLPRLARIWDGDLSAFSIDTLAEHCDAVFLALPDAAAANTVPALLERGVRVFDLSGSFRLRDAQLRQRWYPKTPDAATKGAVYGLPEHNRHALRQARLVACPGCYPTAALLALQPLLGAGLLNGEVVIDAKSGISGAGKAPSERTHFSECHGSVAAYGVFAHRHAAEIEQELATPVTFVPHLVPLDRGILETIYARLQPGINAHAVTTALETAYRDAVFVRLRGQTLPEIKDVAYTNFCDIGWVVDSERAQLVLVACLDNLLKGAAGQAVQSFNVAFDFDERAGLV